MAEPKKEEKKKEAPKTPWVEYKDSLGKTYDEYFNLLFGKNDGKDLNLLSKALERFEKYSPKSSGIEDTTLLPFVVWDIFANEVWSLIKGTVGGAWDVFKATGKLVVSKVTLMTIDPNKAQTPKPVHPKKPVIVSPLPTSVSVVPETVSAAATTTHQPSTAAMPSPSVPAPIAPVAQQSGSSTPGIVPAVVPPAALNAAHAVPLAPQQRAPALAV